MRRLGVTGAAIKKAAKRLGIELPVRRYKNDSTKKISLRDIVPQLP